VTRAVLLLSTWIALVMITAWYTLHSGRGGYSRAAGKPSLVPIHPLSDDSVENDVYKYIMDSSDTSDESIRLLYLELWRRQLH
jgi:hypothetical protein